jgi:hypothetical protein
MIMPTSFYLLDSYGAFNNPGSPMYEWLVNDLVKAVTSAGRLFISTTLLILRAAYQRHRYELTNMRVNIILSLRIMA